ncbi:MAG: TROVE domain-containing protein [Planctomycetaceae bacterium]
MNLNTLQRHGVFQDVEMVRYVADRLADENEIRRSRQFPYQYFAAYLNVSDEIPNTIKASLHKAAEIACGNVPELPGPIVIGLDVSGSMQSAVTGNCGRGATSKMRWGRCRPCGGSDSASQPGQRRDPVRHPCV